MFRNPDDRTVRELLARAATVAVLGCSPRPERPSHRIARRLQDWGYRVIPVRPATAEILGERAYARLADVPGRIDLVDVFRSAEHLERVVDECIALGIPALWIQEGIVNESAAERAQAAGIAVVMDRCISVEYRRLGVQGARPARQGSDAR